MREDIPKIHNFTRKSPSMIPQTLACLLVPVWNWSVKLFRGGVTQVPSGQHGPRPGFSVPWPMGCGTMLRAVECSRLVPIKRVFFADPSRHAHRTRMGVFGDIG